MSAYAVEVDVFRGRYAACPLCLRHNVRIIYWMGGVAFDEHPMETVVVAHPAPIDPGARVNPRATEATHAHARCPMSHAPLKTASAFDHSTRTTKHFQPLLGYCVCAHCLKLPEYEETATP